VRHHVERRLVPVDELAIVPDLCGLLDCHSDSFARPIIAERPTQAAATVDQESARFNGTTTLSNAYCPWDRAVRTGRRKRRAPAGVGALLRALALRTERVTDCIPGLKQSEALQFGPASCPIADSIGQPGH
jgi:hypothetical protein